MQVPSPPPKSKKLTSDENWQRHRLFADAFGMQVGNHDLSAGAKTMQVQKQCRCKNNASAKTMQVQRFSILGGMKMDKIIIEHNNQKIEVRIQKKKIKNVYLKVYGDLTASVSVPMSTPSKWTTDFVNSKARWLFEQLARRKKNSRLSNLADPKNGASTQLLGKDFRIVVEKSDRQRIEKDETTITIYLKDSTNQAKVAVVFERWCRKFALETYNKAVDKMMPIFENYGITKPSVFVKKMKTLWGTCCKAKNKTTFNLFLVKSELCCIEYVALHELTHLIYFGHTKQFYDFLSIHMPDWKERKKILNAVPCLDGR